MYITTMSPSRSLSLLMLLLTLTFVSACSRPIRTEAPVPTPTRELDGTEWQICDTKPFGCADFSDTVTSTGETKEELIRRIEMNGWKIHEVVKAAIAGSEVTTTKGVTYRLVGISAAELKTGAESGPIPVKDWVPRTTDRVLNEAMQRGYLRPPPEVALLLGAKYKSPWRGPPEVVIFHEPILWKGSRVLGWYRMSFGGDDFGLLQTATIWDRWTMFVFLAPP